MTQSKAYNIQQDEILSPLLELLDPKEDDIILEIGCGYGGFAKLLSDKVGVEGKVIAIDPSGERVETATKTYSNIKNIEFVKATSINFPVDQLYDSCVCNKTLHHIKTEEKNQTFKKLFLHLKPGGIFVGNIGLSLPYNVSQMVSLLPAEYKSEIHSRFHRESKEILRKMFLETGFHICHFDDLCVEYPIGNEEKFLSFVHAAFFGKFDFRSLYLENGDQLTFHKDSNGQFLHDFKGLIFCVQKPCSEKLHQ